MKKCPYCFEEIQDEAIKCKHCGSLLEKKFEEEKPKESKKEKKEKTKQQKGKVLKVIGIIILVLFGIALWYISIPAVIIWYAWKKSDWNDNKKRAVTIMAIILVFVLTFINFSYEILNSVSTSSPRPAASSAPSVTQKQAPKEKDHGNMAFIQSKSYIKAILKAPSTADFPFLDFVSQDLGGGRYKVSSYVDSQNSFGAMIRNNWIVTLRFIGGEDADINNWELEEIIFDGEIIYP